MNENASANKTSSLVLGLVVLVASAGVITVSMFYRHSHRLQVRLDGTAKKLQQTKIELEQIKSGSKRTATDLAKTQAGHVASIETATAADQARSKELQDTEAELSELRNLFTDEHPKVQLLSKRVETLKKRQQNAGVQMPVNAVKQPAEY